MFKLVSHKCFHKKLEATYRKLKIDKSGQEQI